MDAFNLRETTQSAALYFTSFEDFDFCCLQSRQPFRTICQMSTIDGSPKLERQVQKLTIQMNHQIPDLKAAGYFTLGRNMILKTLGVAVIFTYFMVQFEKIKMMKS